MPPFATPTADPGFTPRKEFIREQRTTTNVFSLLALSGSSCVRLFAFPLQVITALRRLFDQANLTIAFRENVSLNICEFVLEGKPWSSPKTINSERLLIDILSIIFQHGYWFLSTIDYGRERDDRVAIAFSKPCFISESSFRSGSPAPGTPQLGSSGASTPQPPHAKRLAFALSFTSATVLRVISPPLDCTPAILQAVRSSWPRGVVSERKIAEGAYEFKLKGYKWFQEDTFATDSLQHILAILSSLDAHSFSLLTSLSLSNRSRVKDLWIFLGPPTNELDVTSPDSPVPSSSTHAPAEFRKDQGLNHDASSMSHMPHHRRFATVPAPTHPYLHAANERGRSPTDPAWTHKGYQQNGHPSAFGQTGVSPLFRKGAPRAQVPISVAHDLEEQSGVRLTLPSTISSDLEIMTGVGSAIGPVPRRHLEPIHSQEVIYETSPESEAATVGTYKADAVDRPRSRSPPGRYRPPLPVSPRSKTPPLLKPNDSPPVTHAPPAAEQSHSQPSGNIPLLNSGVFRGSAFTSSSNASTEVAVKWTGGGGGETHESGDRARRRSKTPPGPALPGAWTTPLEEQTESVDARIHGAGQGERQEQPVQELASRVASPEVTHPEEGTRKSERASVGIIPHNSPPPLTHEKERTKDCSSEGSAQGWVLVNVEGRKSPSSVVVNSSRRSPEPVSPPSSSHLQSPTGTRSKDNKNGASGQPNMSAAAKGIAMVDAVDAKSQSPKAGSSGLNLRRWFGLKKKSETGDEKGKVQLKGRSSVRVKTNRAEARGSGHKRSMTE